MKGIGSPTTLVQELVQLFPTFAAELEGEEVETFHQVVQRLAPVITGYLENSPERTVKSFCELSIRCAALANHE